MIRLIFPVLGLVLGGPALAQGGPLAVIIAEATTQPLADRTEALGTAQAREAVDITSGVADLLRRIHFEDGDEVAAGQLLAELEQGAEQADLVAVQARLGEKRSALKRATELRRQQLISAAELDLAKAEVDSLAAEAVALEAAIADRNIRAPFAGRLGLREISPGAYVTPGQRLTRLFDLSALKIEFTVPESRLPRLTRGNRILARSGALPGEEFTAVLDAIAPGIDPVTRSVRVRALLANPDPRLRPGMLLELEVLGDTRQALVVPETALISRGSQQYAYRIEGGKAQRREVGTGIRREGLVEIVTGLSAGDIVIVHGGSKARPGQDVKVIGRYDGSVPLADLIRAQTGS